MINRILQGCKPSNLLYEILKEFPGFSNQDLARTFCAQFDKLDGEAVQVIWNWKSGGRKNGFSDNELDEILLKLLKKAGYL